jgi:hypothetical protein
LARRRALHLHLEACLAGAASGESARPSRCVCWGARAELHS